MTPHTARERTELITRAVVGWLVKRRYSVHTEMGILPWGNRRVDVLAMSMKRHIIAVEVKQCWADFRGDAKHAEYLPFCNQFYFAFPWDMADKYWDRIEPMLAAGVGVLVLEQNGHARVVKNAQQRDIPPENKRDLITRLAWRGGTSRRNSRRNRVFLIV